MKHRHVMIDIETLGTNTRAPVLSLGACFFDENGPEPVEHNLYVPFKWQEQIDLFKRRPTGGTLKFWFRQSEAAREAAIFLGERQTTRDGLQALTGFLIKGGFDKDAYIWAKAPGFDLTILESLYERIGLKPPWKYWQSQSVRTALLFGPADRVKPDEDSLQHHALDDAMFQARQVAVFLKALNNGKKS